MDLSVEYAGFIFVLFRRVSDEKRRAVGVLNPMLDKNARQRRDEPL